jgi:hypothetical protein
MDVQPILYKWKSKMLDMAEQNKEMEEPRTIIKSCTPRIIRVVPEIIGIENTMTPLFI